MRRGLLRALIGLLLLLVFAVVGASFFLSTLLKSGIEKAGSSVTQVDFQLRNAHLAVFSGSGELKGLVIGNPAGFKAKSAIQADRIAVKVVPGSLLSGKVIVHSIQVNAPE